jgi:ubiquinone/menaquinone biosynthesis C-methylase UbiE
MPDFAAIKQKQQATWATGDFSVIASRVVFVSECLCENADLQAGWAVLDVATGSGNAALAAARRGCIVTGADYVPALLERARLRARAEQVDITTVEADAESLPFADGSFDAVTTVFGSMFAPNHVAAAGELARVCRRGGRIALASWCPEGYTGEMFKLFARYLPPPPGVTPPIQWGVERHVREIFGQAIGSIRSEVREAVFRFRSIDEMITTFRTYFGPTVKTYAALSDSQQKELTGEWTELARKYDRNRGNGPAAIVGTYLESIIERA